ncbi:hypothetical protein GSI_10075 [Ganoderma sinense ZZ0214-1]|uniref:Uncharacterized protein n=1 Tax=Ganoderma sinense ZZ0214-1 TaxID=1077348 RepID=A0A2G8RZM2_9APHY|nr:hypothetical protein GSI_10075 [Ganoderma sinense ZZ0214-1]
MAASRYPSDHRQWSYMDDGLLAQTVLEGLGEVLRRSGHAQAPYPLFLQIVRDMVETERQYVWPSTSFPTICPPALHTEALDSFAGNDVDGLARYMQNAYIAPPPYPTDGQMADGSRIICPDVPFLDISSSNPRAAAADTSYVQYEASPSYTASAPWAQGYVAGLHVAAPNEETSYARQSGPLVEPSYPSPTPSPVPSISIIEHLEQGTYQYKQLVEGTPAGPIHFNAGLGVCYGSLDALANGDDPAFSPSASIGVKASIRFELLQLPRQEMRQVRVRHGGGRGREGRPITIREMGERVFDELKKLMDHAESRGDPLRHRGSVIDIERVVLLRVDHISKGSIQPILGIRGEA